MPQTADHELFADLADLVLNVGRLIRARTPTAPEVVPLTETERQVMRLVDLHPGCTPSDIASRARLQRTNVSTALRSLEAKGMVERTAGGRNIAVVPTELARTNLQVLRRAWAGQLTDALHDDLDAIRQCNQLLATLERRLTTPHSAE